MKALKLQDTQDQQTVDEISKRIVSEVNPEKIILFGSYARGTPHEDSDLDLFVIVHSSDQPAYRRLERFIGVYGRLLFLLMLSFKHMMRWPAAPRL